MGIDFESLLEHNDFIRALARRLLLDEQRAEDVVQETYLVALQYPPPKIRTARAWLSTVARNFALTIRRNEMRRACREKAVARKEAEEATEKILERESIRRQVVQAVLDLDEPYRVAVVLRFYDDLRPREIAKRLEIPVETARTHLKRALALLRKRLDGEYGGDGRSWCLALAPLAGLKAASTGTVTGLTSGIIGVSTMAMKGKVGIAIVILLGVIFGFWQIVLPRMTNQEEDTRNISSVLGDDRQLQGRESPIHSDDQVNGISINAEDERKISVKPTGLSMSEPVEVHGRVLSKEGHPLEDVVIQSSIVETYRSAMVYGEEWKDTEQKTKPDGCFNLIVPLSQLPLTYLRFEHPDYYPETAPLMKTMAMRNEYFLLDDIQLGLAYFIRGQVVDLKGNPVTECIVSTGRSSWNLQKRQIRENTTITNSAGRFLLKSHSQYETRVTAFKEDTGAVWSHMVTFGQGVDIPDVKVTLRKCLPISGVILNAKGKPARGKKLSAIGKCDNILVSRETISIGDGSFHFDPLPEGLYTIKVCKICAPGDGDEGEGDQLILAEEVFPGTKNLRFYLPIGSSLTLHLEHENGQPLMVEPAISFQFEVTKENMRTHRGSSWFGDVKTPEPGTFVFGDLREGTFDVTVKAEGFVDYIFRDVVVPLPPGIAELSAVLEPKGAILGKVRFADKNPASGIVVTREEEGGPPSIQNRNRRKSGWHQSFTGNGIRIRSRGGLMAQVFSIVTDETGSFAFEDVKRGEHYLCFMVRGREVYKLAPVLVTKETPRPELEVILPPLTGSIEGMVRDIHGNPLPGACVVSFDGDDLFNRTRSDDTGHYTLLGLPDGKYVVDARMISSTVGPKSEAGSGHGGGEQKSIEELDAYNAVIEKGDVCRLDLTIPDPWNSLLDITVVSSGGTDLPRNLWVNLDELQDDSGKLKSDEFTAATLFRYKTSKNRREIGHNHFQFIDLRGGLYRMELSWSDPRNLILEGLGTYRPHTWTYYETMLLEPSMVKKVTIRLPVANLQGNIVYKETGEPIPDGKVVFQPISEGETTNPVEITVGPDGSFEERNIPAGVYHLTFLHSDYAPLTVKDFELLENVNRTGLRFALERGTFTVKGKLKLLENPNRREFQNWPGAVWELRPEIGTLGPYEPMGVEVAEDGSFELKGLPSGEVKLVVFHYMTKVHEVIVTLPLPEGEVLVIEVP